MHALSPMRLKLELWLGIITMLFLAACSDCGGGCGGAEQREGPAFPAQNTCLAAAAAKDIGRGVSFREDFKDLSAGLTFTMDACVSVQATEGSDFFYKAVVPPNHQLRVGLSIYNSAQPSIYIFTDCADAAGTCVAGSMWSEDNSSPSALYLNTTESPQTLIIGIDSTNSEGVVEGSLSVDEIECLPGERRCDEAGEAIEYCNQDAVYERYACEGLCTDGRCETPSGVSCFDAIALEDKSGAVQGDWTSGTNNFKPLSDGAGQCYIEAKSSYSGLDDFYSIKLQEGEILEAVLYTGSPTASLFILESCSDPETCVQNNASVGTSVLRYYANKSRTVYMVVDNTNQQEAKVYTLQWRIIQGKTCVPDQARCADANTAIFCNSNGTGETSYRCELGCAYGGCRIAPAAHDSCTTVAASGQDIGQGLSIIVDNTTLSDDINERLSCVREHSTSGRDSFYKIILAPDEIVEVKAQGLGNSEPLIYAFTDCAQVSATCVAGAASSRDERRATLRYQNDTDATQTLLIALDAGAPEALGLIQAQINKLSPQCEPGTSKCDPDAPNVLLSCDAQRQYVSYDCVGPCTDGRCDTPKGDSCFDAIELTGTSGAVEGDWEDGTDTFVPLQDQLGLCYIHNAMLAPSSDDDFYQIALDEGDILNLSLSSTTLSSSLFILESCVDPQACAQSSGSSPLPRLRYHARAARTVYVVVEKGSMFPAETYKLRWSVHKGGRCVPSQTRCLNATTATRCSADGSAETPIPCANGCDISGCAPDIAQQDSCDAVAASAQKVSASFSTYTHTKNFTPTLSIAPTTTCPLRVRGEGGDFFYKVELDPNERLRVNATTNGNVNPALYVFKDCGDASGSCLAIDGKIPERTATLDYINTTAATQTLLLGVSSLSAIGTGIIQVDMDISSPQCTPGVVQCDANHIGLLQCDSAGRFELILCDGGCRDDACINPSGDYCVDAIALTGATGSVRGQLNEQWSNAYELGQGYTGACYLATPSAINSGRETFYRVDLQAGEELVVKLNSNRDAQLFLMTDCADLSSCVAMRPTKDNAELRYFAPSPQTVFIAVDNNQSLTMDEYELSWFIHRGAVCAAGTTTCLDPNTVSYCSSTGQTSAAATCANGCFQGGCQAQAALQDICSDVLAAAADVGAGLAIYARYEDFTNSVSFSGANVGAGNTAPGRDLFYKVNLAAGELVRVNVRGYSNRPFVYVIEDCSQSASSYLAGSRTQGSADSVRSVYANTTGNPKTVLVGIDSSSALPTGPVKATIERLSPECTPGDEQCTIDGFDLLRCSPQGLYARFPCDNGCANDACVTP